jgi:hypothetical protein
MSSAYGFTEDSARRIARVVKSVEGDTTEPTRIGPMLGGSTMSVVKVTFVSSPLSTGTRLDYHASDNVLVVQNEVKIREVNGQDLKVNTYYVGFFSGYTSAGQPVFLVSVSSSSPTASGGSGGSGGSGTSGECFDVIQSIDCTDGELTVTYATICPDSGTAIIVGQQNLVGDVASPGANMFYGTNGAGVKGWYPQ